LGVHLTDGVAASHKSLYLDDRSISRCESVFMVY
jgi:hypothetical protein